MKILIMAVVVFVSAQVNAEIYKCQIDGKTIYSDQECKGGKVVKVEPHSPDQTSPRVKGDSLTDVNNRIKKRLISEDIERAENRINGINQSREAELSELSRRVSGRSNNARDAIDKNTLAVQMGVINDMYNRRVIEVQREIVKLNAERDLVGK
jgi:hypothetical protein